MTVPFFDLQTTHAEIKADLDGAWHSVTATSAFIGGPFVERFEEAWAAYCGTKHCVGLADGTAALQLALEGLGVGRGDEVIVPANTFVATAEAVVAAGATPVFIDVDPVTLLMTATDFAAAITPRTAAVIPVHLYGQPADMDAINHVAVRAGIAVIEDAAQAHGAKWNGRRTGSLSRIGCFSFYPGKNLGACGDAGAVVTDDAVLANRIRSLSNHGRASDTRDHHILPGGNNRLDGVQAAVLLAKLKWLDTWNQGRQRAANHYREALAGLPVELVPTAAGAESVHHLAVIRTARRDDLRDALHARGIGTGVHYRVPCHRQPVFAPMMSPRLPVVEAAAERIMSLPMFPHLTKVQVTQVADAIAVTLAGATPIARLAS